MENNLPKILVISSVDPLYGPGMVALDHYNALRKSGAQVDFLTKYPVDGHPEFLSVCHARWKKIPLLRSLCYRWINFRNRYYRKILEQTGYYFFYRKEDNPPVPIRKVLRQIRKDYDIVYILFWQELLSFATVKAIYDKTGCQVMFRCPDYSHMAGGCHFVGDCERYKTGCGMCPAIKSTREDDFTAYNVQYRKKFYETVRPVVFGNSYMTGFYRQSYLLRDYDLVETVCPLVDNVTFHPCDETVSRKRYSIGDQKSFIIFFGCQLLNDERKGMKYLLEALKLFHDRLTPAERDKVLVIFAGKGASEIEDDILFDHKYLGYVDSSMLPYIYSLSSVFICPSVNDAGPTMVNQAMSCGTPVVAFEMGTALDVVKGKGTGYCARLRDSDDLAHGIEWLFRMPLQEYTALRDHCRKTALELTSDEAYFDYLMRLYNKLKQNK